MKRLLGLLLILCLPEMIISQTTSNYYPLNVGNYWIQHTDSIDGAYNPSTFYIEVEGADLIDSEIYYRVRQEQFSDSANWGSHWWIWMQNNQAGMFLGAIGDTNIIGQANIFESPIPFFPNGALVEGYTWEFDFPGTQQDTNHWVCTTESVTETITVPAGTFTNCVTASIAMIESSGDTSQISYMGYAENVGQVLNAGWNSWIGEFIYELTQYSVQPVSVDRNDAKIVPVEYSLYQNYPNPFNPATTFTFDLPVENFVNLSIFDLTGQLIVTLVNEKLDKGSYQVDWNADALSTGIYFYKITAGKFSDVKKCLILK